MLVSSLGGPKGYSCVSQGTVRRKLWGESCLSKTGLPPQTPANWSFVMSLPSDISEAIKVLKGSIKRENKRLPRGLVDSLGGVAPRIPRCRQPSHSI